MHNSTCPEHNNDYMWKGKKKNSPRTLPSQLISIEGNEIKPTAERNL